MVSSSLLGAHELVRRACGGNENEAANFLVRAAQEIQEASQKISTAVQTILGNKMGSSLANTQVARKAIAQLVAPAQKKTADAINFARAGIASLEKRSNPKMPDDVTGALLHQEVRSALSKMDLPGRNRALELAISSGDESFLAAATSASPTLSGLTSEQQKSALERWRRTRHSDDAAKIASIKSGVTQLMRISEIFTKWSSSLIDEPSAATIAAAEQTATRAKAAGA